MTMKLTQRRIKTATLVTIFLFAGVVGCIGNNKKKKNDLVAKEGQVKIFAVYTRKDSARVLYAFIRQIVKGVKYDSANGKDIIVIDTNWFLPVVVPLIDSSGKAIFDSAGNPKINPVPEYILIPKDSVNYRIENISVDSLLRKK